uniref:Uncharacterized protein n=1 Tax=Ananas comosus var. bracteatus TaxID=296719 RepID=A0A6V7PVJ3_ANACO|nr:unnamed protein product [Ananas comosus var. bracteatus]
MHHSFPTNPQISIRSSLPQRIEANHLKIVAKSDFSELPRGLNRKCGLRSRCCSHGQKIGIRQICNINGKPGQRRVGFLLGRVIPFAISDGESSFTECDSDTVEGEKFEYVVENHSPTSNASLLSERTAGKPGFISFYGISDPKREDISASQIKEAPKVVWFIGPTVLVAFLVFPSLYLRKILSAVFEDSLLTDFLILFFTEALFYGGVAIFVLLVDLVWRPQQVALKNLFGSNVQNRVSISSVAILALSLTIPLLTMGLVWPWTGPAASAALAPYLVGLVVQFAFEQYARYKRSPAWPVIPIIFQVYRLHQLNRAAQLVTALSFSIRGVEATSQTVAISNSLGALLAVLQILGVICMWSLSSFLMRFLPPVGSDASSQSQQFFS